MNSALQAVSPSPPSLFEVPSQDESELLLEKLPVSGLSPFSLQDFPGHTAAIFWFQGCNMRCGYCHNPELVCGRGNRLPWVGLKRFLLQRRGLLDGVVLSGGECTLHPELTAFLPFLRSLGYAVKLDTNGTRPELLKTCLGNGWLNYVALDCKADPAGYKAVTGWGNTSLWEESFSVLRSSGVAMEIRCTVHPDLVDEARVSRLLEWLVQLGYRGVVYLQHYLHGVTLGKLEAPSRRFQVEAVRVPPGLDIKLRNFADFEAQRLRGSPVNAEPAAAVG